MIYTRTTCWKVNKGKINLENMKIITIKVKIVNDSWFKKKYGINCGIAYKKFI